VDDVTPAPRLTATVTLVPLLTDAAGSTAPLTAVVGTGHALMLAWVLPLAGFLVLCGLAVALRGRLISDTLSFRRVSR
jgi:hypothetical protein